MNRHFVDDTTTTTTTTARTQSPQTFPGVLVPRTPPSITEDLKPKVIEFGLPLAIHHLTCGIR